VGKIITEKAFTSTSYTKGAEFKRNTRFTIYSETGKKIDFLSNHPYEKEVLFKPGTEFRILSKKTNAETGIREIVMEEVPSGDKNK